MVTLRKLFFSELTVWLACGLVGLYFIVPLKQKLRFGSDLVGGTYLTLEVHTQEAVKTELVSKLKQFEAALSRAGKNMPREKGVECETAKLTFTSAQDAEDAVMLLRKEDSQVTFQYSGNVVSFSFIDAASKDIKHSAIARNIEVLRTRLDKYSVSEIPIAAKGERNIIVELPDVANPLEAKAMIGTAAQLEFLIVERIAKSKEDLLYELDGYVPADKLILPSRGQDGLFYLVRRYADVTGAMLQSARVELGGKLGASWVVAFQFDTEGKKNFYELTKNNYGRNLAIVLDGVVVSAPVINQPIDGSSGCCIEGNFTHEQAKELALLLRSGAYVARVTFEEERQIGPSLGDESRASGFLACAVGLLLLLLFSIVSYKFSGLLAFVALLYNMLIVLVGLAWLRATLTLPGIGGIILTVGMAIDASILIYERIKEELRNGAPVKKAVQTGFSDAMAVILDANITTFIVGIVLYYFGTGPIQGFAVTMMLGIIATLISGLFFLKSLFNVWLNTFDVKKLSI